MSNPVFFKICLYIFSCYAYIFGRIGLLIPFPKVLKLRGQRAAAALARCMREEAVNRPVIITDAGLFGMGMHRPIVAVLQEYGMQVKVFSEVTSDPSLEVVRAGIAACRAHNYDAVVAFGGGSVMDAAKLINVCSKKDRAPESTLGLFRVLRRGPFFACIPTTAGTGSEVTVAAVITDNQAGKKLVSISPCLLPHYAVLDESYLRDLPAHLVAGAGIDALTHALEAFLSRVANTHISQQALEAVRLVYANLEVAVSEAANMQAKANMLEASHLAGQAFTRASVGWVHAIAHQLGALYHVHHGLANAIVLPKILNFYLDGQEKKLAKLSYALELCPAGKSRAEAAKIFVDSVVELNNKVGIPGRVKQLRQEDISIIAQRAFNETVMTPYPVPKYFSSIKDLEACIGQLI